MASNDLELQIRRVNRKRKIYSLVVLAPLVAALVISSVYTFAPFVGGAPTEERDGAADTQALLEQAVKDNPGDIQALIALGNYHYDRNDFKSAESRYKQALARDPDNPDVQVDCGTAILYQDRPLEAIAAYRKALARHPRHVNGHVNLGIAYQTLGQNQKAAEQWHEALRYAPDVRTTEKVRELLAGLPK